MLSNQLRHNMNRLRLLFISAILLQSCSQKVYFFEADKLHNQNENYNAGIFVDGFFAGDALDYVVFELDVKNESSDTIYFGSDDVYLKIYDEEDGRPIELNALDKNFVIQDLNWTKAELDREKKGRDIGNAISIGLNLLALGTGSSINALDVFVYSTDTAAYMLEDSRSHKLIKGSLEEQVAYVEDWVLYKSKLGPGEEDSWDILFERNLYEADAELIIEIEGIPFTIPFKLKTLEEKVR